MSQSDKHEPASERERFMRWWGSFRHDGDVSYAAWGAWLERGRLESTRSAGGSVFMGPCSCADEGRCKHNDQGPLCMQESTPSHALRSESPLAWLVFVEDHPEGWDYMVFANEDDAERQAANEAANHPDGEQPEVFPLYRGSAFTKSATASGWSKADWFSQPIHTIYVQPETTHIRQRRQGAPDDVYEMALPPLPDRAERTVKE